MNISTNIGDSRVFRIPLRWEGSAFVPGNEWALMMTVKSLVDDPDSAALMQKSTNGYGITIDGATAVVSVLRADTFREADYPNPGDLAFMATAGTYIYDVKASGVEGGAFEGQSRTVAGPHNYILKLVVGRSAEPTATIYTTEDPILLESNLIPAILAAPTLDPILGTELVGSVDGTTLKKSTWSVVKAYILSGLRLAWGSLDNVPLTFAPTAHKASHATGGSDALTAADIGAAEAGHTHPTLGTDLQEFVSNDSIIITSSTGSDATLGGATPATSILHVDGTAGLLLPQDKLILNNTSGTNTGDETNASINALIEDDAAATRSSLALQDHDMQAIDDLVNAQGSSIGKVASFGASNAAPLRIAVMGDSYSGWVQTGPKMANAGLFNAGFLTTAGSPLINNQNGSGLPKRYDYWFNGVISEIPAGSEGMFSNGFQSPTNIRGNRWTMYYLKGPSFATSFDLEWESSNNPNVWTLFTVGANGIDGDNVSAYNASVIGAVFTANLLETSEPAFRIRVKNISGGSLVFIQAGVYHTNGGGAISIGGFSDGGIDLPLPLDTPSEIYTPILKDMAIDCFVSCWADAASNWETGGAFRTLVDRINTATTFTVSGGSTNSTTTITYALDTSVKHGMFVSGTGIPSGARVIQVLSTTQCVLSVAATATAGSLTFTFSVRPDIIQVSPTPAYDETGREAARIAQREWAMETGQTYINAHAMFKDYATGLANGLCGSDGTHLTVAGARFLNHNFWNRLPLGKVYLGAEKTMSGVTLAHKFGLGNIDTKQLEIPTFVKSTGIAAGYGYSDQASPLASVIDWSSTVASAVWSLKKGPSSYLIVSGAIDGTAGVRPGFNGMDLGNTSNRWRSYINNSNINGSHTLVPDTQTATTAAVSLSTPTTALTTTAPAQAITLANGIVGQVKTIMHVATSGGGTAVLTPTTKTGFATITFTNVGDTVTLQYFTTYGWMIIAIRGATPA